MAYFLTSQPENAVPGKSWVPPKTHTPGSRLEKRGSRFYMPGLGRWASRDPIREIGRELLQMLREDLSLSRSARPREKGRMILETRRFSLEFDIGAYENGRAIAWRSEENRQREILSTIIPEMSTYGFCKNDAVFHCDYLGLTVGTPIEACFCATCVMGLRAGCVLGCTGGVLYNDCVHDCMYTKSGDQNWPDTQTGHRCRDACTLATLPGPGIPDIPGGPWNDL